MTDQLQPIDSPIAENQGAVSAFGFDANNERNVITAQKIRNFSFDQGQGGTLTLGGANNGNGVLNIKDASGSSVVTADNTGITIKDSSGTTIIDPTGLNSLNNFSSGGTSSLDAVAITSGTYVPITNGTVTFVLSRESRVLFMSSVQARIYSGTAFVSYQSGDIMPRVNGTNLGGTSAPSMNFLDTQNGELYFGVYTTSIFTMSRQRIVTVGAGTVNFTLVGQTSANGVGGTMQVVGFDMNYVVLGK